MPRFVLLAHDHPTPHLDFMLEMGQVLWTWRLSEEPGDPQPALRIADHRLHYLDYQGPVSGGRGTVTRRNHGTFEWIDCEAGRVVVRLTGQDQRGVATISRVAEDRWELTFVREQGSE